MTGVQTCALPISIFNILGEESKDYTEDIEKAQQMELDKIIAKESPYVKLARKSLTHYLKYGKMLELPEDIDSEFLTTKKPVFVTLKKKGALRGCIGSTSSREDNLAQEIIKYAVEAGLSDPRFPQVSLDELQDITISVDVALSTEPA